MTLREALLRGSLERLADGAVIALDPTFQGLPDAAHGGTVLALFDAVAGQPGPRRVRGDYLRSVPLATAMTLRHERAAAATRLVLESGGRRLVEGVVSAVPVAPEALAARAPHAPIPLPVSPSCFVCGVGNGLGLRAALAFDDDAVHVLWRPRETLRTDDGAVAAIAVTALLDETAFWLGALRTGESGMTTELDVTLLGPAAFGEPLTVVGARHRVTPRADPRYLDTEVGAFAADGTPVATARITFVAIRGAARRLVAWLAAANPPDVVRRVFPAYTR